MIMSCIVSNQILIQNASSSVLNWCSSNLVIKNPEYEKKVRLGLYVGKTPKNLVLFEKNGKDIVLPFGCFQDIFHYLQREDDTHTWIARFHDFRKCDYKSKIKLYDYQESAVCDAIRKKNGIIVMPCGAGKTQTALELIARLGGKALWVTHTRDLLKQSKDRAKANFDCDQKKFGEISEGKVDIGEFITFSTVQTLCNIDLCKHKDDFDVIVVDECHKAVGTPSKIMMFYKVLSSLSARYKFGITATPKRSDGLEKSMFALLGNVIHEVDIDCVKNNVVPVNINFVQTGYKPSLEIGGVLGYDGTIDYGNLIEDLVSSNERNMFIVSMLKDNKDCVNLILSDRVKHLHVLCGMLGMQADSAIVTGDTKKERKTVFDDVRSGKIKFLFSTYALAKEGLDIPNLNNAFLVTPKRDYATVVQSSGRVSRKDGVKKFGTVYDLVDDFGFLQGMAKSRKSHYKKEGYILL